MKKYFLILPVLIILGAVFAGVSWQSTGTSIQTAIIGEGEIASTTTPANIQRNRVEGLVKVGRVIDGDTIEIEGGEHVRYIGMNTPETVDPRKPVQCFGHEASERNRELVEGKFVRLAKDITERDKYGRLLRYVFLPTGATSSIFINLALVEEGYAFSYTFPPDVKYQKEFVAAERAAREAGRGLWAACVNSLRNTN